MAKKKYATHPMQTEHGLASAVREKADKIFEKRLPGFEADTAVPAATLTAAAALRRK